MLVRGCVLFKITFLNADVLDMSIEENIISLAKGLKKKNNFNIALSLCCSSFLLYSVP